MPLSKDGRKVLKKMKETYGEKEGTSVFYATMKKRGMKSKQEKTKNADKNEDAIKKEKPPFHKKLIKMNIRSM